MFKKVCYGCAHEATNKEYPGRPSGERPCCFCTRNDNLPEKASDYAEKTWYDGSTPAKLPMDCYYSLDMLVQMEYWARSKKI